MLYIPYFALILRKKILLYKITSFHLLSQSLLSREREATAAAHRTALLERRQPHIVSIRSIAAGPENFRAHNQLQKVVTRKKMDINNFTREEIAALDRIAKTGELQAMDKVQIVVLTSEKGRPLNGREGSIRALNDNCNDGRSNPYIAQQPDGRYMVSVEFDETIGREERPGHASSIAEQKTFSLKRENLVMKDVGPGTIARDPEGKAILYAPSGLHSILFHHICK